MSDGSSSVENLGLVLAEVRVCWCLDASGHASAASLLHCIFLRHCDWVMWMWLLAVS